jgi:hypothetical protein
MYILIGLCTHRVLTEQEGIVQGKDGLIWLEFSVPDTAQDISSILVLTLNVKRLLAAGIDLYHYGHKKQVTTMGHPSNGRITFDFVDKVKVMKVQNMLVVDNRPPTEAPSDPPSKDSFSKWERKEEGKSPGPSATPPAKGFKHKPKPSGDKKRSRRP